jgi:flavin-dependent dehydrogenase
MILPGTIAAADASREPWDAVVVGAGPAGSVAARELARLGKRVLLVDKAEFPRRKVCGCCLNAAAVDSLERLGLGVVLRDAVPLTGVRLATAGHFANVRLPGGVALSRDGFDAALIREAIATGVEFLPGTAAKLGPCEGDFRTVRLGDATVRARVAIAADGLAGSFTAADGNAPVVRAAARIGAGTVADHAPNFYTPGTIFMAVGRGGYVGLVRLEDGRLDVAAAFDPATIRDHGGLGAAAVRVLQSSGFPAISGLEALPWKGTPALTRHATRVAGDRWFAVGDAAGYVEPFTGEGMAWAVAGAAALAPIADRAINGSPQSAAEWAAAHARVVRQKQGICRAAAWVLRSPVLCRLGVTALSLAPRLAGPVVGRLNRPRTAP